MNNENPATGGADRLETPTPVPTPPEGASPVTPPMPEGYGKVGTAYTPSAAGNAPQAAQPVIPPSYPPPPPVAPAYPAADFPPPPPQGTYPAPPPPPGYGQQPPQPGYGQQPPPPGYQPQGAPTPGYPPGGYQQGSYPQPGQPYPASSDTIPGRGYAIASLVLGLVAILTCWFGFLGLAAGIVGVIMAVQARKLMPPDAPRGMATAGMVLSIISIVIGGAMFLSCAACSSSFPFWY